MRKNRPAVIVSDSAANLHANGIQIGNPDTQGIQTPRGIQESRHPVTHHRLTESPVGAIRPGIRGRGSEAV